MNFSLSIHKKLNAGALYYALFVIILCMSFSGSFLLLGYLNDCFISKEHRENQVIRNVNSAIETIKSEPGICPEGSRTEIDLFGDGLDKVTIEHAPWLFFDIYKFESAWKHFEHSKMVLMGQNAWAFDTISLYLVDKSRYLSISGNSRIVGDAYLPILGIRRASIEGHSLKAEKEVFGKIHESTHSLPIVNDILKKRLLDHKRILSTCKNKSVQDFYHSVDRSFEQPTVVLQTGKDLRIANKTLAGNVVVYVNGYLEIDNNATIDGAIMVAQKIRINEGFSGYGQFIATDSIIIEEDCSFSLPTMIAVAAEDLSQAYIHVGPDNSITGSVGIFSLSDNTLQHRIHMADDTKIYGLVYCNGSIELKGEIFGTLYCEGFYLKTRAGYYENHLLDGSIDRTKLPEVFSFPALFCRKQFNELQWLN